MVGPATGELRIAKSPGATILRKNNGRITYTTPQFDLSTLIAPVHQNCLFPTRFDVISAANRKSPEHYMSGPFGSPEVPQEAQPLWLSYNAPAGLSSQYP